MYDIGPIAPLPLGSASVYNTIAMVVHYLVSMSEPLQWTGLRGQTRTMQGSVRRP